TAAAPNTGKMRTFSTRYWIWVKPRASGPGSAGSTISLGAGSFATAKYGVGPRTSLALWAKAPVASTVPAPTAASVLMSRVITFSPLHRAGRAFLDGLGHCLLLRSADSMWRALDFRARSARRRGSWR